MQYTILAWRGSDPGEASARAHVVVPVDDAGQVAAAAEASSDAYVLLLAPGAKPLGGAFGGLTSALALGPGVLGGATHAGGQRLYGWMLAPAPGSPLPFELNTIAFSSGDASIRGPIDVVAPGMVLARRELLLEPLPADPVAALVELCARAREAGHAIECRPAFACAMPPLALDDRGRTAALREIAVRRPELSGHHREPAATRSRTIHRDVRLEGGSRARLRMPMPPITMLLHGHGADAAARRVRETLPMVATVRTARDPAAVLRAEMQVRGDRYVLVARATAVPDTATVERLVETIEEASFIAVAAAASADLDGTCVLLAVGRFPQHIIARGTTIDEAIRTLVDAAVALRRGVRAPGIVMPAALPAAPRRARLLFLASSTPAVTKTTLDAFLAAARSGDELIALCAANAETVRRLFAAYPQVRVETDAVDPLLTDALNRAIGACERELVVLVADDVVVTPGSLERMRAAFERIPTLGAAFPCVAGASGAEGLHDTTYTDVVRLGAVAETRQRSRARELEPIDIAVTPVVAVARAAFDAVGGIDPAFGPTRRGIADLVARLRAAGYGVVRCEDTLVHRFDLAQSHNPAAAADANETAAAFSPATAARGFHPAQRVPFERDASAPAAAHAALHAIVIPVSGPAELDRAAIFLSAVAAAFDASAPIRVHVVLDGKLSPAEAAARIRPVLANSGRPMEQTVSVRIERVTDLDRWRAALESEVRIAVATGHERAALAGVRHIGVSALRDLLEPVAS